MLGGLQDPLPPFGASPPSDVLSDEVHAGVGTASGTFLLSRIERDDLDDSGAPTVAAGIALDGGNALVVVTAGGVLSGLSDSNGCSVSAWTGMVLEGGDVSTGMTSLETSVSRTPCGLQTLK